MKKSIYTVLIFAAALSALVSCKKEQEPQPTSGPGIKIRASFDLGAKANFAPFGASWDTGDVITVKCGEIEKTYTSQSAGQSVTFSSKDGILESMYTNPLAAFYSMPNSTARIPMTQTAVLGRNTTRVPMFAYTWGALEDNVVEMSFRPASSVIQLDFSSANVVINEIELAPVKPDNMTGTMAGTAIVDVKTGTVTPVEAQTVKNITLSFGEGSSLAEGLSVQIPVLWFSVTGGLRMTMTYDGHKQYEEILWPDGTFRSYSGNENNKSYSFVSKTINLNLDQKDFYVKVDGDPVSRGTSWSNATTLDAALAYAQEDATIHIAAGTYYPSRVLKGYESSDPTWDQSAFTFEINKLITLIGGYPENPSAGDVSDPEANETVISTQGNLHAITITALPIDGKKVTIKNLSVSKNNQRKGIGGHDSFVVSSVNGQKYQWSYGSGIYAIGQEIVLDHVNVYGNFSFYGGVFLRDCPATVESCSFTSNESGQNGAGLFIINGKTATIRNSVFTGNTAGSTAAGVYLYAKSDTLSDGAIVYGKLNAIIENCNISQNEGSQEAGLYVRASCLEDDCYVKVSDSKFLQNHTGGVASAACMMFSDGLFENCDFNENTTGSNGVFQILSGCNVIARNCRFMNNEIRQQCTIQAYAENADTDLLIDGCTIANNVVTSRAGGIYANALQPNTCRVTVLNTTIADNISGSYGSAIGLYARDGESSPVIVNVVSSTIYRNIADGNYYGGAVSIETEGCTFNMYNSILSGNYFEASPEEADILIVQDVERYSVNRYNSIVGMNTYKSSGAVDSGAPEFYAEDSFEPIYDPDEKPGMAYILLGDAESNPGIGLGMDLNALKGVKVEPAVPSESVGIDQFGNARTGKVMGAYVFLYE